MTGLLSVLIVLRVTGESINLIPESNFVSERGLAITPKNISELHDTIKDDPLIQAAIAGNGKVLVILSGRFFPCGQWFNTVIEYLQTAQVGIVRQFTLWEHHKFGGFFRYQSGRFPVVGANETEHKIGVMLDTVNIFSAARPQERSMHSRRVFNIDHDPRRLGRDMSSRLFIDGEESKNRKDGIDGSHDADDPFEVTHKWGTLFLGVLLCGLALVSFSGVAHIYFNRGAWGWLLSLLACGIVLWICGFRFILRAD